ncbi:sporulation protein SsgA [Novosphingobium sp. ERN07]|uniref:SPOR domain-containing protein n=1 Tax=Novosphingobium sp. ERN07 TaxID=2726187 RepID=UPI00145703EC|nr:SPOR domain-containing protein [Novosphingobium sp. ERN07]NLR70005.1 sporulation protein SsgA [Novosphingobium sp. ERN07]
MRSAASLTAIAATLLLAACGGANAAVNPKVSGPSDAAQRGPAGDYPMVLGEPFVVDGVTYTPADTLNYDSVGYAHVAGGDGISGAHRTLPLPSYVEVTSLETGRTILVRLTQRGPMTGGDLVSLSAGAWAQLGAPAGVRVPVRVRRVNPPEAERALLRSGASAPARMDTPTGLLSALRRKLGIAAVASQPAPETLPAAKTLPAAPVEKSPVKAAPLPPKPPPKVPTPKVSSEAKAAPVPVENPAEKAPVKVAPTPAKGLFVQVGAYSDKARAEAAAKAVGGVASPAGKLWRVRVGPHKDRGQADAALAKVRAAGYADARVVTAP